MRDDIAREIVDQLRDLTATTLALVHSIETVTGKLAGILECLSELSVYAALREPVLVRLEKEEG